MDIENKLHYTANIILNYNQLNAILLLEKEGLGMKLSKKQELLALGSALYLIGLEVEGNRAKLQEIVDRHEGDEVIPITQELLDGANAFENAKREFARLEKKFLELEKEI